jgi:Cu(I)/Ag(I) efflux system membrane fusion protein
MKSVSGSRHVGLLALCLMAASLEPVAGQAPAPTTAGSVTASASYNEKQSAALAAVVAAEIAASTALAGEDWNAWLKAKPAMEAALKECDAAGAYQAALKRAQQAWPTLAKAADFAHARAAFVKVSDNVAQAVLQARASGALTVKVAVYYCPMTADPANAKWVQGGPPLRNPFWGKEMPDCGAEVKP